MIDTDRRSESANTWLSIAISRHTSLPPMWIWIAINRHTESTAYVDMDRHQSAHRVYCLCGYGSPSIGTPSLLPAWIWIAIIRHTESTSCVDMDRHHSHTESTSCVDMDRHHSHTESTSCVDMDQSGNRACRYMALVRFSRQTEPADSLQQFNAISRHSESVNVLLSIGSIGKPSCRFVSTMECYQSAHRVYFLRG